MSMSDTSIDGDAGGDFEPEATVPTRYWQRLADGRVQCDLCPRACKMHAGQRGLCFVRGATAAGVVLASYGRSSGLCIDPIEKKPLNHFHPGTAVLSLGTAGCNLACKFCQNWDISKSREHHTLTVRAMPDDIAAAALAHGCQSVAFTYNDPVIFHEYALDIAAACHARNIKTVAVTAGYVCAAPRAEFFAVMDAANVDLKSFNADFYQRVTGSALAAVLETLEYIAHETRTWLEITTLVIPGLNDSDSELRALSTWVREHLGAAVPLHFSAFHPDWKMRDVPPTPPATLTRARRIALDAGLQYVYTGNVHDAVGDATYCHACGHTLIQRDWYEIRDYALTAQGRCPHCDAPCAGRFGSAQGQWGRRRVAIKLP
ncbi:MAG: AmmeMemoRadiSam system radical SAM enzyme [Gammaproteobacteria bacterium]|nr:AmmeMemoRadiSam system radical SAM enzyme [Gammaproteobacteria bacterium]